jgi:hypothetical protein
MLIKLPFGDQVRGRPDHEYPIASQVDVLPTILDYIGIPFSDPCGGESLFRKTAAQIIITGDNGDRDPIHFCIQSKNYKAFFSYASESVPIADQSEVYLERVTDTEDQEVKADLEGSRGKEFLKAHFGKALNLLYPHLSY